MFYVCCKNVFDNSLVFNNLSCGTKLLRFVILLYDDREMISTNYSNIELIVFAFFADRI